jgi:hypothetical protein
MEGIHCEWACLKGANLSRANLKKAKFNRAIVDDSTIIAGVTLIKESDQIAKNVDEMIDDETDFSGVALSTARIDPDIRTRLDRNIRNKHWEEWYSQHRVLKIPVQGFWDLSGYGTTCVPCIVAFAVLIVAMYIIYSVLSPCHLTFCPELLGNTILATFGIGDPGMHGWGRLLVAFQAICGYFLLSVLITRFAVMFQSLSP